VPKALGWKSPQYLLVRRLGGSKAALDKMVKRKCLPEIETRSSKCGLRRVILLTYLTMMTGIIYSLVHRSPCFRHWCAHHQEPFLYCTCSLCSPSDVWFDVASSLVQVIPEQDWKHRSTCITWTRLEATSNRTSLGEQRLHVQERKGSWWWAQQCPKYVERCTSE
jgi:hypothetical protein